MSSRGLALATAAMLAFPAAASGTTFRGSAVDDPATVVTLRVSKAGVVRFDYTDVMVSCSNGDDVREPGADHSTMLGDNARFSDTIDQELAPENAKGKSFVKGHLRGRKAAGVLAYDLLYDGGECHSGNVRWKAHRKKFTHRG